MEHLLMDKEGIVSKGRNFCRHLKFVGRKKNMRSAALTKP